MDLNIHTPAHKRPIISMPLGEKQKHKRSKGVEGYENLSKTLTLSSSFSGEHPKMASTVGVPSLYQVPHLETSKPTSKKRSTCFSPLSLDNPFFSSPISLRTTRLIHSSSAVATPNSVLSEEAFKSLGLSDNGSEEDDGEELAISKLGLPQRLGESLEKRGITHLFPIQVLKSYPFQSENS